MIKLSKVKKIVGKKNIARIKLLIAYPQYLYILHRITEMKNNKIYLLGTPIHDNLGDHLIAIAETELLKKNFSETSVIEIPTEMYILYKEKLKQYIEKEAWIIISGGGWMGNIWETDELIVQDIIKTFPDNKKVIFPQTIYYDSLLDNYEEIVENAKKVYSEKNLVLMVRDAQSYETALNELKVNKNNLFLLPDIALLYAYVNKNKDRDKIAICMRNDREINNEKMNKESIFKYVRKASEKCIGVNTIVWGFLPVWCRKLRIRLKLKEFEKYSLIITDRLHAMIMAAIVQTPCIAINNRTDKVRGVYELWINKKAKVKYVSDWQEFQEVFDMRNIIFDELPCFDNKEYVQMFQNIRERVNCL